MSVKEFFAFANIKLSVIEFLKSKSDFEALHPRHKKPFRAHINKHHDEDPFFVSDGFNSIKCRFSEICKKNFAE
jgi:hypothetical protein